LCGSSERQELSRRTAGGDPGEFGALCAVSYSGLVSYATGENMSAGGGLLQSVF
jgi:hypothetical protein